MTSLLFVTRFCFLQSFLLRETDNFLCSAYWNIFSKLSEETPIPILAHNSKPIQSFKSVEIFSFDTIKPILIEIRAVVSLESCWGDENVLCLDWHGNYN
jgi:hypothetical protein